VGLCLCFGLSSHNNELDGRLETVAAARRLVSSGQVKFPRNVAGDTRAIIMPCLVEIPGFHDDTVECCVSEKVGLSRYLRLPGSIRLHDFFYVCFGTHDNGNTLMNDGRRDFHDTLRTSCGQAPGLFHDE
jgi:hypothetical protein